MNPEKQSHEPPNRLEKSIETEKTSEFEISPINFLQEDLQKNYTDHLRSIEKASFGVLDGVVKSAQIGFITSIILNIFSFLLGSGVIITGLVILIKSPENMEKLVGIIFSLMGIILIVTLLFWKGPLDRILESVSNLARINVITIGLAHRLNQISRVFVQESLKGKMTATILNKLNLMIYDAVHHSVSEFSVILPKKQAEEQVQEVLSGLKDVNNIASMDEPSK